MHYHSSSIIMSGEAEQNLLKEVEEQGIKVRELKAAKAEEVKS